MANKATPFELAEQFAESQHAADLTVITGVDDIPPIIYAQGRWNLISQRYSNGSMSLEDITIVEVQSKILTFLREIGADITASRVREVERLARLLVLQKG